MESPQRALRYPNNKVQGPPTIVGWTKGGEHHAGMENRTHNLLIGAMSPNHQAKARGAL